MMSPRKKKAARKSIALAKKPSPKKMSYVRTSTSSSKKKRKPTSISIPPSQDSGNKSQDSGDKSQYSTPSSENPVQPPRSNERYAFRNVTPPSYKLTSVKTPLRTPSGKLQRTPARHSGRTPVGTPFRTPRLKSLSIEPQPNQKAAFKTHKEEAVTWKEHLRLLTSKFHKICYLSSVKDFMYQKKNLRKKYESHLQNKVLSVHPSPRLTVSLSTTSCLSLQPNAVDAVRIEINSLRLGDDQSEDVMVNIYNAWMFRTSRTQSLFEKNREWFPVMLYSGREEVQNTVLDWLGGSFGCYVTKCGIQQNDLMWIAGVWSGRSCSIKSHQEKEHLKVDLVYIIHPPHGVDSFPPPNQRGKPRISLCIDLEDVRHIWNSIVDSSSGKMKEEERCEYFSTIESIAGKMSCIPKYLLYLHQLQTPCINLKSDGRIRVPCSQSVRVIVKHLLDISFQTMNVDSNETREPSRDE